MYGTQCVLSTALADNGSPRPYGNPYGTSPTAIHAASCYGAYSLLRLRRRIRLRLRQLAGLQSLLVRRHTAPTATVTPTTRVTAASEAQDEGIDHDHRAGHEVVQGSALSVGQHHQKLAPGPQLKSHEHTCSVPAGHRELGDLRERAPSARSHGILRIRHAEGADAAATDTGVPSRM